MITALMETQLGRSLIAPDYRETATRDCPSSAAVTPPWPHRWEYQRETISTDKLCFRAPLPPCWNWGNSTISNPGKLTCNAIVQPNTKYILNDQKMIQKPISLFLISLLRNRYQITVHDGAAPGDLCKGGRQEDHRDRQDFTTRLTTYVYSEEKKRFRQKCK